MALTPIGSVGSQLERAIAAYLIDSGCGSGDDILPAYGTVGKKYPLVIVQATESQHLQQTGVEAYEVQLIAKQSAVTGPKETNPNFKRVELEQTIGLCHAAMVATDALGQDLESAANAITAAGRALHDDGNNADMAEFTLQYLTYSGASRGKPDEENCSWQEVRHFVCQACARAIN